nr:uncharacterized protein LOC110439393 [Danio rerio]|eukprot:XP_021331040.1 uncharacterized protein LOC110439393 [Danio rerio]
MTQKWTQPLPAYQPPHVACGPLSPSALALARSWLNVCPMLQRLPSACSPPDGRSQGDQLGREAAAARAGRRPRGHAEDAVPGPGLPQDFSLPRQALEAARGALDRRVLASLVLRGGAGLGGPRGRPPVRGPRLQVHHGVHTGSAHGPGEADYQDAVHPAPNHTPLPGAKEGRRVEKEEEEGEENQVASCTTGSRARSGRRSDAPRASGGFGTPCLPIPGPRPRAELSIFQARLCRCAGCVSSGKLTLGCARSTDLLYGEFEGYQLGSEPTARLRNNVSSKLGRIKAFLGYMAALSEERGPVPRLPIGNPAGRLSSTTLVLIRREVRALIRGIRRRVVVHEVRTKQAKESRLIPKASLVRCQRTAGRKIPALLDSLESNPSTRQQWRFYGFLTGYLTSIPGHRCGVFQNLTIQEVEEASRSPDESSYVNNITTHKTNRAFGAAQLSLNREKYSWFRRFLALRAGLPGGSQATYFFFTSRASPCRTLNKHFQSAWVSMGLPGKPTFTDVRTAIATHAKNAHSSEDRRKVAQFMCHDTSTSDKFYALHLGPLQAREPRRLFERALVEEEEEEEEEEDGEAAGTESPPRKGRKRTETPVSPLEGTSRRTLPWHPARGKSQGARPLEPTEDSELS